VRFASLADRANFAVSVAPGATESPFIDGRGPLAFQKGGLRPRRVCGHAHRDRSPRPAEDCLLQVAVAQRIAQPPVSPANPYWQRNARAYADPDGFQILLTVSRSTPGE